MTMKVLARQGDSLLVELEEGIYNLATLGENLTSEDLFDLLGSAPAPEKEAKEEEKEEVKEEEVKEEVKEEAPTEEDPELTEEDVEDMDRDELIETIDLYELGLDPKDYKKTKKLREAVLEELFDEE